MWNKIKAFFERVLGYFFGEKCNFCSKRSKNMIFDNPVRHMLSPNGFNQGVSKERQMSLSFCSKECRNSGQKERYSFWAELDRNASDSKCFVHEGWEKRRVGLHTISMRKGHCRITGKSFFVEPLQPGENSGQPKECVDHFELLERYN